MGDHPHQTVCAVVVAFHPDAGFASRLVDVLHQVDALVVVDNTPAGQGQAPLALPACAGKPVSLVSNEHNRGQAAALNQGLAQAAEWQCRWLLTLDQDSRSQANLVGSLLQVVTACQPMPVVIGANYLETRNRRSKVPVGVAGEYLEQKTVITSGALLDVRFARSIGGFREDYFIDQVDHEFCLRARAAGGRVVISRLPVMYHDVGEPGGAWVPLLGHLPGHAPVRKYYVARNSLVTIAAYWRTDPEWCLRRLVRLLSGFFLMVTLERQRLAKVRLYFAGVMDAVAGRMGPCRRRIAE